MTSSLLLTFASLLTLSLALPSSRPIPRTPYLPCAIGRQFYTCSNGYRGCYDYDPCSLPAHSGAPPPPAGNSNKEITPAMYNLYYTLGAHDSDELQHLDVRTKIQGSLARFDGVPASAKECQLMWRQPKELDHRSLNVTNNGLVKHRQLLGFPKKGAEVNVQTLKPFINGTGEWSSSLDFSFWQDTQGGTLHIGPPLICSGLIAVEFSAADDAGSKVFIENKADDGLFLKYE